MVTTQLATKFLNPDGTPANYDSGSRAILVPQLGKSVQSCVIYADERIKLTLAAGSDYLPPHRTYRVLIVPQTRTSGFEFLFYFTWQIQRSVYFPRVLRLLLSPSCDSEGVTLEEPYEMASSNIARDTLSDAPLRTGIRWVLVALKCIAHRLPVSGHTRRPKCQHTCSCFGDGLPADKQ